MPTVWQMVAAKTNAALRPEGWRKTFALLRLFIWIAFTSVMGCSFSQNTLLNSRAVLQRSELQNFSARAKEAQDTSCVRVEFYAENLADKSIDVIHKLSQCVNMKIAIGEFKKFSQPFSPASISKITPITGVLAKADEAKAWCDDFTGMITVIEGASVVQNQRCTMLVRYGRMVSSLSVIGNIRTGYWPNLADLTKFTEDRIDILQDLGK
jgi:hypothetical protein